MDAAEYKHIVLGLIFLKYISDSFVKQQEKIRGMVSDPSSDFFISEEPAEYEQELEERDYYTQDNVFWVPQGARWETLRSKAKQPDIGSLVDGAMTAIENKNTSLRGKLDKRFGRAQLGQGVLGELIDLISTIGFADKYDSSDLLGEVYEYFLGQFASAEGKKGGQFYTPSHVVKTLVAVLSPNSGRVYDPCCGSGGMFVQSEEFVRAHGGRVDDISIYGQESNPTTWRLAAMNLAIRGFAADLGKEPADTFARDQFPDHKFDFILANPPFNDSDWGGERYAEDVRWQYGRPPASNANFAWIQQIAHKLKPDGKAGIVLANASLTSNSSGENVIRQNLLKSNIVEAVVELSAKLFVNFSGPVCIWFLNNSKNSEEVLLINAQSLGRDVDAKLRVLDQVDIDRISRTINDWRVGESYVDSPNFCKSVSLEEISQEGYSLSTKRYVYEAELGNDETAEAVLPKLISHFEFKRRQAEENNRRVSEKLASIGLQESDAEIAVNAGELSLNETTQQIATQLFKGWFKDFNPIFFPDIEDRDDRLAEWFPEEFVDTQLGSIPDGWRVKKIRDVFDVTIGRTPPRKEFNWFTEDPAVGIPWVSIADLKNTFVYQKRSSEFLTPEAVAKFNVPVVQKGTVILSFKLTVGRTAIAGMPLVTNEAIAHFDSRNNPHLDTFIFYFLRSFPFDSLGSTSSIGTAINSTILKDLKFVLPPEGLMKTFDETVKVILEKAQIE